MYDGVAVPSAPQLGGFQRDRHVTGAHSRPSDSKSIAQPAGLAYNPEWGPMAPLLGGTAMTGQNQLDDQSIYDVVHKVTQDLLPLDPYSRLRVYRTIGIFFGFEDSYPKITGNVDSRVSANASREPQFSSTEEPTPKEFMIQKRPSTNVERVACLAYYLTHFRNIPHFKNTDINKLNTEAAQIKLSNVSYTVRDAVRAGYLAAATKDTRQLSAHGEQYVEALPDRAAAKEVKPRTLRRSRNKPNMSRSEGVHGQEQVKLGE